MAHLSSRRLYELGESTIFQQNPILSLPDELLCLVFAIVAHLEPPWCSMPRYTRIDERSTRNARLGFIRLSEVCTRFRALLHSIPSPWAAVAFTLPEGPRKLALSYSQSALLKIDLSARWRVANQSGWAHDGRVAFAVENAARIGSLAGNGAISGWNPRNMHYEQLFGSEIGLASRMPNLRSLSIKPPVAGLAVLADILQHSPRIEDLEISLVDAYGHDRIDWETVFGGRRIKLEHLQSLVLSGKPLANMPVLFQHICSVRPARCVVNLECDDRDEEDTWAFVGAFGPALRETAYDGLMVKFDRFGPYLMAHLGTFRGLHDVRDLSAFWVGAASETFQLSVRTTYAVGLEVEYEPPLHRQIVHALIPHLECDVFKEVIIDAPGPGLWDSALQTILAGCTAATSLLVCHGSEFPVSRLPGILPALRTLFVKAYARSPQNPVVPSWWKTLLEWLEWRARTGPLVQRLYLLKSQPWLNMRKQNLSDDTEAGCMRVVTHLVEELVDERAVVVNAVAPTGTAGRN